MATSLTRLPAAVEERLQGEHAFYENVFAALGITPAAPPQPPARSRSSPPAARRATAAAAPVYAPARSDVGWRWPTDGQLIGRYVSGDPTKQGIDVAGSSGQAVRAAGDGVVVYSGTGLVGYAGISVVGTRRDAEASVHTIGVDPAWQGRGIGKLLLRDPLLRSDVREQVELRRIEPMVAKEAFRSSGDLLKDASEPEPRR